MNEHFYNGFIKRAQDYGLSVVEADRLVKVANDWSHHGPSEHLGAHTDSSFNADGELPHGWWRAITTPITAGILLNRYLASRRNKEEVTKKKENVKKANHQQLFDYLSTNLGGRQLADHLSTNTQASIPSYPTPSRTVHSNWPEGIPAPDGSWSTPMSAAPKDVAKKYNFTTNPVPFSGAALNDDIQNSYGRMDHVRNTGSATGFAPINSAYDPRYIDKARKLNAGMAAQNGIPYDSRIK